MKRNEARDREICEAYERRENVAALAVRFKTSESNIYSIASKYDVTRRVVDGLKLQEIVADRNGGLRVRAIAARHKIATSTVYNALARSGVRRSPKAPMAKKTPLYRTYEAALKRNGGRFNDRGVPRKFPCRLDGCTTIKKLGMIMCARHWQMVPEPLRKAVDEARDRFLSDLKAHVQSRAVPEHLKAATAAFKSLGFDRDGGVSG